MDNKISLFIAMLILAVKLAAQDYPKAPPDHRKYFEEIDFIRKNAISTRTEWNYQLVDGNVTTEKHISRIEKFNQQGCVSEITVLDKEGIKKSILIFIYTSNKLPFNETEFTPQGKIIGKVQYKYNEASELEQITQYKYPEKTCTQVIFIHSVKDNIIIAREKNDFDSVQSKIIYYYSNLINGAITQEWNYVGENYLNYKKIINWGQGTGKIESEEFYSHNEKIAFTLKYKYNTHQRLSIVMREFTNGDKHKASEYNYNDSGLITGRIEYNFKGEIVHYLKFTYN